MAQIPSKFADLLKPRTNPIADDEFADLVAPGQGQDEFSDLMGSKAQSPRQFAVTQAKIDAMTAVERDKLSFGERFSASLESGLTRAARGYDVVLTKAFGPETAAKLVQDRAESLEDLEVMYDHAIGLNQLKATAGGNKEGFLSANTLGQVTAGAVTFAPAFLGAPGIIAGAPFFFAADYGNAIGDLDSFERQNGVELPTSTRQAVAIAKGTLGVVQALIPGRAMKGMRTKLLEEIGTDIAKGALSKASTTIMKQLGIEATEGALINAGVQAGHNIATSFYDEEMRSIGKILEGTGTAAALGFVMGAGGAAVGAAMKGAGGALTGKIANGMVKDGLLSPTELATVLKHSDNPANTLFKIRQRREAGDEVSFVLKTSKTGKESLEVKIEKDVLTSEQKKALGWNRELIEGMRKHVKAGGKAEDFFNEPELIPPSADEVSSVVKQLEEKKTSVLDSVMSSGKTEFVDVNGLQVPATRRALFATDLEIMAKNVTEGATKPGGRGLVEQAKALLRAGDKGRATSTDVVPPMGELLNPGRTSILTPTELVRRLPATVKFTLAEPLGYLLKPESFTTLKKVQARIAAAQRKLLERASVVRRGTLLSPTEADQVMKSYEIEFVSKMDEILQKVDDNATGAAKQVTRRIRKQADIKEQPMLINLVTSKINDLVSNTVNLTQRETLAKLMEEFASKTTAVHAKAYDIIESIYKNMDNDLNLVPFSERVARGRDVALGLIKEWTGGIKNLEEARGKVQDIAKTLPDDVATKYLNRALGAQSEETILKVLMDIEKAQSRHLRAVRENSVIKMAQRLEKNPKRETIFKMLKERLVVGQKPQMKKAPKKVGAPFPAEDSVVQHPVYHWSSQEKSSESQSIMDAGGFWSWSHFGTNRAALERSSTRDRKVGAFYKVWLRLKNPFDFGDESGLSLSTPRTWADAIMAKLKDRLPPEKYRSALLGVGVDPDGHVLISEVSRILEDLGYDGVKYINSVEDAGNVSYIVFHSDQVVTAIDAGVYNDAPKFLDDIAKAVPDSAIGEAFHRENARRAALARDRDAYATLSGTHAWISSRLDYLVENNALTRTEAYVLRYIFSQINDTIIGQAMKVIDVMTFEDIKENPGWGAFYNAEGKEVRIRPIRPFVSIWEGGLHNFIHEFYHGVWFHVFDDADRKAITDIFERESDTPSKRDPGLTRAQASIKDIFRSSPFGDEKIAHKIDYYNKNPGEYFAEQGAIYALTKKTSIPVLKEAWGKFETILFRIIKILQKDTTPSRPSDLTPWLESPFKKGPKDLNIPSIETSVQKLLANAKAHSQGFYEYIVGADAKMVDEVDESITKSSKTGQESINEKGLRARLKFLPMEQLKNLENDMRREYRHGQIEKGVYDKWMSLKAESNVAGIVDTLSRQTEMGRIAKAMQVTTHAAKSLLDPVSNEGKLWELSQSNESDPIYSVWHGNLEKGISRASQHNAETRRFVNSVAKETLGFDTSKIIGEYKFLKYLQERLPNGVKRHQAMWVYALSTDPGRAEPLAMDGATTRDGRIDVEATLKLLSAKDKAFVDKSKEFFGPSNLFVAKAGTVLEFFTGTKPQFLSKWFTSRRALNELKAEENFQSFELQLIKEVDALKARTEDAGKPFDVDSGYLSAYYRVADRLALYAEAGRDLYDAERALMDPRVQEKMRKTLGEGWVENFQRHLVNVRGLLSKNKGTLDAAMDRGIVNWTVSKIALNIASGLVQTAALVSTYGDNVLKPWAIRRAVLSGSGFSKEIDKEMMEWSGFSFMRLSAGRFAEQEILAKFEGTSPGVAALREASLFMQRGIDRWTLRMLWKAAKLTAQEKKLEGRLLRDETRRLFEKAVSRNQASNNPLYASPWEEIAKEQPAIRGWLTFGKELNRLYNTTRRHVVTAAQKPTAQNINQAGRAIFWTAIMNSMVDVGIREARRAAFGQDVTQQDASDVGIKMLKSLAGRWYVVGDVADIFDNLFGDEERIDADRYVGPFAGMLLSTMRAANHINLAIQSGKDPDDVEFKSGPNRGESKFEVNMLRAADEMFGVVSGLSGLPFFGAWFQARGFYTWSRDDLRRMRNLEREKVLLERKPEENQWRLEEIGQLKEQVNKVHRLREKGLYTKDEASKEISRILKER